MVTAATLFEQYGGEKYLYSRDSLGQTAIGSLPSQPEKQQIEEALHSDAEADVDLKGTLDPLVASMNAEYSSNVDAAPDNDDADAAMEEPEAEEDSSKGEMKTRSNNNQTWLWVPLKFRPIPKKGEFDVRRLRDSQYFFS